MADSIWERLVEGTLKYAIDSAGSVSVVKKDAFAQVNGLLVASFPSATQIQSEAFRSCTNLLIANFSSAVTVWDSAFFMASNLRVVYFPNLVYVNYHAFRSCAKLSSVFFPNVESIGKEAFWDAGLNCITLEKVNYIGSSAFESCVSLRSVYILASSICSIGSSNTFRYTPMDSSFVSSNYGSIYVPASLYSGYKEALYWSSLANRFVAI